MAGLDGWDIFDMPLRQIFLSRSCTGAGLAFYLGLG
jgi:hypothetical protein